MTIKQIRVGLNMTQKDLAEFLGMSVVTYRSKEKGKKRFYFDEVKLICDKANVDISKVEA